MTPVEPAASPARDLVDMHLNPVIRTDIDGLLAIEPADLAAACSHYEERYDDEGIARAVMVLLDASFPRREGADKVISSATASGRTLIAWAPDPRSRSAGDDLAAASRMGVGILKFHPYLQKLTRSEFESAAELARQAESLGMPTMVCCSYGTRDLATYDGIALASHLTRHVSGPVIASHAGGARILDAMLVAADCSNLYLDTSFSLSYYRGSSIEKDIAFAMRKLGPSRWLYGSDAPFIPLAEARAQAEEFFDRHAFSAEDRAQMFSGTANAILPDARGGST